MNALTAFGLAAAVAMLLCYAAEERSPWFTLAFAASCVAASVYGFLQGAWPFGVVEAVWSACAARRWWRLRRSAARGAGRLLHPLHGPPRTRPGPARE